MSSLVSRNVVVRGHRTSLRLERAVWDALDEIATREGVGIGKICERAATTCREHTLTASVRVYVLSYFREAATPEGHAAAGHGTVEPGAPDRPGDGAAHAGRAGVKR